MREEIKGVQDLYVEGNKLAILTTNRKRHYITLKHKRHLRIILLRNTTYKCGRIQRSIVNFLSRNGRIILCKSLSEFRKKVNIKCDFHNFLKSLRCLQDRFIVAIE